MLARTAPSFLECGCLCIRARQVTGLPSYSRCLMLGYAADNSADFRCGCVAYLAHSVEKSLRHDMDLQSRLTLGACQGTFFSHCYGLANRGRGMSFQITVLKVLAGHPGGRASLGELRRAVAILISSGSDWTNRTKRLLARAPGLDIFTQAFVLRDEAGWQITHAGKAFLAALEAPIQVAAPIDKAPEPVLLLTRMPASPVIRLQETKRPWVRGGRAGRRHSAVALALRSN